MAGRKNLVNGHAGTVPEDENPEETAPVATVPAETKSRKKRIRDLLSKMEESLGNKAEKATVADFIRLTQLERELEQDEQPGKVVVTWKESPEIQDSEI
jgi:hypothetical protein